MRYRSASSFAKSACAVLASRSAVGLPYCRLLQRVFGTQTGQHRCALLKDRFGMIGRGADIAIIEAHQHLSGIHPLVVGDQNLRDESGDVRRDRGDVSAYIGIVGALEETTDRPPMVAVPGRRQGSAAKPSNASCLNVNRGFAFVAAVALHFVQARRLPAYGSPGPGRHPADHRRGNELDAALSAGGRSGEPPQSPVCLIDGERRDFLFSFSAIGGDFGNLNLPQRRQIQQVGENS